MKKKIFLVILALALIVCAMTVFASAATVSHKCEACGQVVTWEPLDPKIGKIETDGHYHYYLEKSYSMTETKQITINGSSLTVCLDLNGNTFTTSGRSLNVKGSSVLNIMDSSDEETGAICAYTAGNNPGGGTATLGGTCVVNLYSGNLRYVKRDGYTGTGMGGIMSVNSGTTFNMYGGRVEGAELVMSTYESMVGQSYNGCGAAFYVAGGGTAKFYGGTVVSGTVPEDGKGPCVYLASATAKMTLSGDANVEHIYSEKVGNITISGKYTGKTRIFYGSGANPANGVEIGTSSNADLSGANIFCINGDGWDVQVSGTKLKLATHIPTATWHWCQHCKDYARWLPLKDNLATAQTAGQHHLYMSGNYETTTQFSVKNGAMVCLDLYGQTFDSSRRALHVATGTQLNVMDTVGGGKVLGHTGSNNPDGGVAVVQKDSVLNMYSGTLEFIKANAGYGTGRGGVMTLSGTLNLFGGTIKGGEMVVSTYVYTVPAYNGSGGAIHMLGSNSVLNVSGGQILSGSVPAGCYGPCVFVEKNDATVTISGNAMVEDICYTGESSTSFRVVGDFAGSVNLSYLPEVRITGGTVVGSCAGADISGGTLTCGDREVFAVEDKLECSTFSATTVAGVITATSEIGYDSLQEALNAYTGGYIQLCKPTDENVTVSKTVYLDMNGFSIGGTVTVADGAVLYGMDSQTDDYDVSDGVYGKLTVVTQGAGKVMGAEAEANRDVYLLVEESGKLSFHRLTVKIYAVVLRPDVAGIYYRSNFRGDEKVAAQIAGFGVALSTEAVPTMENMESDCLYSAYTGFEAGANGNTGKATGVLLTGILKATNGMATNLQNLNTQVYGRAYVKTLQGQCLLGFPVCNSLVELVETVDTMTEQLSNTQTAAVLDMYGTYKTLFGNRKFPGFAKELEKQDGEYLRILMVGNSHGLDATKLLCEVFKAEMPEQKFVVGTLHYDGCTMPMHAQHATNNEKVYDYYKNDGSKTNGAWTLREASSILDALQDEQWDIVVMQQQNEQNGITDSWNADAFKTVINYVNEHQPVEPKLMWQMLWTNPDNYNRYIGQSATLAHPDAAWYQNYYETNFAGTDGKYDHEVLYNKIVTLTQQKLADSSAFLGQDYFDGIIPAGTTVEYAMDVLKRPQHEMYRDWTHLSDFGRLMVAYQWYAEIMELDEITEVNMDAIPEALHHEKSTYPANLKLDNPMKQDIISAVNWSLGNPYEIPEESEEETLCILGIGNSYTSDSMWLLEQVYRAENPNRRLKLGIAYRGGCSLAQHVKYLNTNATEYTYYFLDSYTGTWTSTKDSTLQEIIADQQWELVSMQQASADSGRPTTYNSDIQTIQTNVEQILGYKPTFFWNMTWAYPTVDIPTDNYTLENAPNASAFKGYYNSDQMYMYGKITETVQAKIVPDDSFAWIMPTGTAIQNANSSYLTDYDLYRDYTHLNDFARVIASYVWYSKLENVVLDTVKIQKVEAALTNSYKGGGDMVLTDAQRDIIAESVKNALTTPFAVTQSTYTQAP